MTVLHEILETEVGTMKFKISLKRSSREVAQKPWECMLLLKVFVGTPKGKISWEPWYPVNWGQSEVCMFSEHSPLARNLVFCLQLCIVPNTEGSIPVKQHPPHSRDGPTAWHAGHGPLQPTDALPTLALSVERQLASVTEEKLLQDNKKPLLRDKNC